MATTTAIKFGETYPVNFLKYLGVAVVDPVVQYDRIDDVLEDSGCTDTVRDLFILRFVMNKSWRSIHEEHGRTNTLFSKWIRQIKSNSEYLDYIAMKTHSLVDCPKVNYDVEYAYHEEGPEFVTLSKYKRFAMCRLLFDYCKFNPKTKFVLYYKFFCNMTLEQIGNELNDTRESIRLIMYSARNTLRHPSKSVILSLILDSGLIGGLTPDVTKFLKDSHELFCNDCYKSETSLVVNGQIRKLIFDRKGVHVENATK